MNLTPTLPCLNSFEEYCTYNDGSDNRVEVVSPDSVTRDYRYKRSEYAALEIPEYWIVDSITNQVTVLLFEEGLYEERIFSGEEPIISRLFCQLDLKVNQIFAASYLG